MGSLQTPREAGCLGGAGGLSASKQGSPPLTEVVGAAVFQLFTPLPKHGRHPDCGMSTVSAPGRALPRKAAFQSPLLATFNI